MATSNQESRRPLRYETLEDRCVLSASGLGVEFADADQAYYTSEDSGSDITQVISHLKIQVNDDVVELTPNDSTLQLTAGDHVTVLEIGFQSSQTSGVFAAEGYVSKISDFASASLIDYNDGRFSERDVNPEANGSGGIVGGLSGEWVVEEGWDRLTINLMHYTESGVSVEGRMFLGMQVGTPDLTFNTDVFDQYAEQEYFVGERMEVPVSWFNQGTGNYHNYAELDIYNAADMDTIVWAGASVGNTGEGSVEGIFVNTRGGDNFDALFVPQEEGEYVFKFYVDPEGVVNEYNEDNNEYEVRIKVGNRNEGPTANDDRYEAGSDAIGGNVMNNDTDPENDDLSIVDFEQPENGKVFIDENGEFKYKANEGFEGEDQFSYTLSDGQETDTATVYVDVTNPGIEVNSLVEGKEDTPITLFIDVDTNRFDSALIQGVPEGASIDGAEQVDANTFLVNAANGPEYVLTPPANSDVDFTLTVTPTNSVTEVMGRNSETIDVVVSPVLDGANLAISNFGIATGSTGQFPLTLNYADQDGSEVHTLTLFGVPDNISFSAGTQNGDTWTFTNDEMIGLEVTAESIHDQRYRHNRYEVFSIEFELSSSELDSGETRTANSSFKIYLWYYR